MEDFNFCVENSKKAALQAALPARPTFRPSRKPTPTPSRTKKPRTKRPTRRPAKAPKPTRQPTPKPIKNNSSPTEPNGPVAGVVYYPDLTLGVCKFDGLHGTNPYWFSTPQACCTNKWMDFDKCMAYADPYSALPVSTKFYPDFYEGYCRNDGQHGDLDPRMVFDNANECCDNAFMVYHECLTKTRDPPKPAAPEPTRRPTPEPTQRPTLTPTSEPTKRGIDPNKLAGIFYPDLEAGLCISDGRHDDEPYVFDTLEKCCTSNVMNYQACIARSLEIYVDDSGGGNDIPSDCMWHPDPSNYGTCAYDSRYLDGWAEPDRRDSYLFHSHERCCEESFGDSDCVKSYDCDGAEAGPTPSGYWTSPPSTRYPTWNPTRDSDDAGDFPGSPVANPPTREPTPASRPSLPAPIPEPAPRPTPKPWIFEDEDPSSRDTPRITSMPAPRPTARPTARPASSSAPPVVPALVDATGIDRPLSDSFEGGSLDGVFPWHTSPDLPWALTEDDRTDGSFSAVSHPLGPGQNSNLQVTIKSPRGGVLSFDFKTDVQMPFSGCTINIDGEAKKGFTYAKPDWFEIELQIPPGERVIMFRAWAPNLGKATADPPVSGTIGVDNVSFMPAVR